MSEPTLEQVRDVARAAWARGDYRPIGERLRPAAHHLVQRAGVEPDQRVLDVGVGTGSVAVAAARRGAEVVGIDISDHWWQAVREHAAEHGVSVDLRLGDAEELPFRDGSFDVVLSSFAMIFAPRHDRVVAETSRVVGPGGTIGLTAWPVDGGLNSLRHEFEEYLPSTPAWAGSAHEWGDPATIRSRFAGHGVSMEVEEGTLTWTFPSLDEYQGWLIENSGPMQSMLDVLDAQGVGDDGRRRMREVLAEDTREADGQLQANLPYLLAIGTRG